MKPTAIMLGSCLAALAFQAQAYCVYNELKDRSVTVVQDTHPETMRENRVFNRTVAPGEKECCDHKNLDCNPDGKGMSPVGFTVKVLGDPVYVCGIPRGSEPGKIVKIAGAGTMRVQPNPKFNPSVKDAALGTPYIARLWGADNQDFTGPAGLPCRP
jgi:hypothetical protein